MAERERSYICIDLKSFYASVECADRGLDPFTTDLVVADPTRSANTICLAITPAMKAKGIRNRCRLRDIPAGVHYTAAMPRMHRYLEVSTQIYSIYLRYVSTADAWPYSVDECFLDVTGYRRLYRMDAKALAKRMIADVRRETGIAATAGIGPNMFLAKLALDVVAKHADDGIGVLDRASFMRQMWFHQPITDVWGIGPGIARRLARRGVVDLAGICALGPDVMRREFGKNGAWLLDHAWGQEPCTIAQARGYVPKQRSLSNGQVLMRDYEYGEALTVLREMVWESCLTLTERRLVCTTVGLWIGYSGWDGRPGGGGQCRLAQPTDAQAAIEGALLGLYRTRVARDAKIRRICLWLGGVAPVSATVVQPTLFDEADAAGARPRSARGRCAAPVGRPASGQRPSGAAAGAGGTAEADVAAGAAGAGIAANADAAASTDAAEAIFVGGEDGQRPASGSGTARRRSPGAAKGAQAAGASGQRMLFDAVSAAKEHFGTNAVLRGTSLMPGANARERNQQIGGHRA